jgi:hypothetical protein
MALKQRKILREKLAKEKKVHERQERTESNALDILRRKGDDVTKLNSGDLSILLTWHQVSKVVDMNKDKKLAAWLRIVGSRKSPPSFEKWTDEDEVRLEEAQSDLGTWKSSRRRSSCWRHVRCRRRSSINWFQLEMRRHLICSLHPLLATTMATERMQMDAANIMIGSI